MTFGWSTSAALDDTTEAAERAGPGSPSSFFAAWYDVDDDAGLERLRRDVRSSRRGLKRVPATARVLETLIAAGVLPPVPRLGEEDRG